MDYWNRVTLNSHNEVLNYFKQSADFRSCDKTCIEIKGNKFSLLKELVDGLSVGGIEDLVLLVFHLLIYQQSRINEPIIGLRDLSGSQGKHKSEFIPHCSYIESEEYLEDILVQVHDIYRAALRNYDTFKFEKLMRKNINLDLEAQFPFEFELLSDTSDLGYSELKKLHGCRLSLVKNPNRLIIYFLCRGYPKGSNSENTGANSFLDSFVCLFDKVLDSFDRKVSEIIQDSDVASNGIIADRNNYAGLALRMSKIWESVIELDLTINGEHDFFKLGGTSLDVFRVVNSIRKEFDIEFTVHDFLIDVTFDSIIGLVDDRLQNNVSTLTAHKLDFEEEVSKIANEIVVDKIFVPNKEFSRAFLTGATGFLGIFLLSELLNKTSMTVTCLIRAPSVAEGTARLVETFNTYQIECQANEIESRVEVVIGDISEDKLGLPDQVYNDLAESIDVVYHNGANVNAYYPYSALKSENVNSTKHIVKFAIKSTSKPVHFISTPNVLKTQTDGFDVPLHDGLSSGYAQTKWVAEHILVESFRSGLPVVLYRPYLIVGHSRTGAWKENDLFYQELLYSILVGKYPNKEVRYNLVSVDLVAESIVKTSLNHKSYGKSFHLVGGNDTSPEEICGLIRGNGINCDLVPRAEWISSVQEYIEKQAYPDDKTIIEAIIKNYSSNDIESKKNFDCEFTSIDRACDEMLTTTNDAVMVPLDGLSQQVMAGFLKFIGNKNCS